MEPASDFYYSQPGFRGNLSASQSQALFKLWRRFLRLCQTSASSGATSSADRALKGQPNEPYSASSSASASNDKVYGNAPADYPSTNEALPPQDDRLKDHLRSLEENKDLEAFLRTHGGAALKREFWGMVKGDHPDAVMLRFLRARKWDVDRALSAIGSTCAFRLQNNVSQLLKDSELGLTKTVGGMNIFRNGISYIVGATPTGEPVYIIEVGSHYSSNQTAEELKKGVIFLQECLSMMMPPPVERKVVIFNLNNFGLRNMDWGIVLFMAKTMESFYPETLSRVYVHGAPWIFKPIWSILRPLLDPVVRDKIRLTWKVEELAEYVPADRLPKTTMHGDLDREFAYLPPDPSENDVQKDLESYERYRMTYLGVVSQYEDATRTLAKLYSSVPDFKKRSVGSRIGSKLGKHKDDTQSLEDWEPEGMAALKANRDVLATKLRVAWLRLKPYVVGKTSYERRGILRVDGTLRWEYPSLSGGVEVQILGEGTSLPALERGLEEIDEATHPGKASATNGNGASKLRPETAEDGKDESNESSQDKGGKSTSSAIQGAQTVQGATGPIIQAGKPVDAAVIRPSVDTTSEFKDALPVHPSDPSFGMARNGDPQS